MYLLYDCFTESNSFTSASEAVLRTIDIDQVKLEGGEGFKYHGGYYGRVGRIESFVFANVYNIWLAVKKGAVLLALEEDSYANLVCALSFVYNNEAISEFLSKELQAQNLELDINSLHKHIAYFPSVIATKLDELGRLVKLRFSPSAVAASDNGSSNGGNLASALPLISRRYASHTGGFSTCLYYSNRHYDCGLNGEYEKLGALFSLMGLKAFEMPFSLESYTHLLAHNEELAYQKSGELLYAGIDLGVDFLCTFSDSVRDMFDSRFKLCTKHCGRDKIEIPTLHLAQIILLSLDKAKESGIDSNRVRPNFVLESPRAS